MSAFAAGPHRLVHLAEAPATNVVSQLRVIAPAETCGLPVVSLTRKGPDYTAWDQDSADAPPLLVVQRTILHQYQRYRELVDCAGRKGVPIVYDVDDLLLKVADEHPDRDFYDRFTVSTFEATLHADVVIVSTEPLRRILEPFHPHVRVVPNRLPSRIWDTLRGAGGQRPRSTRGPLRVGYVGTRTHHPDLHVIAPALKPILTVHPEVTFVCYGVEPPTELAALPNTLLIEPTQEARKDYLSYAREVYALRLDIGIAPLIDSEFNRCKSLIKMLEYGALGIPGVYANIEPYAAGVQHGVTGILAGSPEDWRHGLERLIGDQELRLAMGAAAQRLVEERWLLAHGRDEWRAAWQLALEVARTSPRPFERPPASDLIAIMRRATAYQQRTVEKHRLKRKIGRLACHFWRRFKSRVRQAA